MRKRKSLKKTDNDDSDGSEGAGEPEEFQDSGEDWTPDADTHEASARGRKRGSKGTVNNSTKKKRKNSSSEDSEGPGDDDEDAEGEEEEGEGELDDEEGSDDEKNGSDGNKSDSSQSKDVPKHFHSGNFVLLKSDVKWDGDTVLSKLDELNLWKIDGKALLQKFIPMESNGRILHKCTCVYSGWNVYNRDNYYPITEILDRNPRTDSKEICVALDLNDLIKGVTSNSSRVTPRAKPTKNPPGEMAARLDPCELPTVVPYTYTLSERSAELHGRRSGDVSWTSITANSAGRHTGVPTARDMTDDSSRDRHGIGVTRYRHGSGPFRLPGAEAAA
ncbi:hypothetical protein EVAR_9715_1 [Eumeta japonica]|uniref:Uncharacterized protein n=1 Tax=Eumeta variegata TaxID=151549 RepID=A0A4C1Z040_EUMVA|nr:hypothetical protein EVAR_9715_1 [Eumeta japonica]